MKKKWRKEKRKERTRGRCSQLILLPHYSLHQEFEIWLLHVWQKLKQQGIQQGGSFQGFHCPPETFPCSDGFFERVQSGWWIGKQITSFGQNGQLKSPFVLSTNKVFPSKSLSSSTVWWSRECDARVLLISLRQISHQNPILTPTDVRRERELKRKKRVGETGNENEKKKWCYGFSFSFSCFFFIFFFLGFDSHLLVIW